MLKERPIIGFFMAVVGALTTVDIFEDLGEGADIGHLGLEIVISISCILIFIYLLFQMKKERSRIQTLLKEKTILEDIANKYENSSRLIVEGLGVQIDQEFNEWGLTDAEREVALFLLKGLTISEISDIRQSAEKTVRHQSTAIYKKAGLKGRGELQAYFLEDLLSPQKSKGD